MLSDPAMSTRVRFAVLFESAADAFLGRPARTLGSLALFLFGES